MSGCVEIDQGSLNQLRAMITDLTVIMEDLTKSLAAERPTLRDYFATHALQCFPISVLRSGASGARRRTEGAYAAQLAYEVADAMLAARRPRGPS